MSLLASLSFPKTHFDISARDPGFTFPCARHARTRDQPITIEEYKASSLQRTNADIRLNVATVNLCIVLLGFANLNTPQFPEFSKQGVFEPGVLEILIKT